MFCYIVVQMMVHAYNLSCSGCRDPEDLSLRLAQAKVSKTPVSISKLGRVDHVYNPNY
jgi:hypothetical protein